MLGSLTVLTLVAATAALPYSAAAARTESTNCANAALKRGKTVAEALRTKASFDEDAAAWRFAFGDAPADIAGDEAFSRRLADRLRNRRLLFVGDSTARNPATTLIALLCNPARYASCRQVLSANGEDGSDTGLPCANSSREFSMAPRDIAGDCANRVKIFAVPLQNVTALRMPKRQDLKQFWRNGLLAPLTRMIYPSLNLTIDVASAGCGSRDGLDPVLNKLMGANGSALEDMAHTQQTFGMPHEGDVSLESGARDPQRPYLSNFDAVVLAGGLHCKVKHFTNGGWYRYLAADVIPRLAARLPVVFTEMTACLKFEWNQPLQNRVSCNTAAEHTQAIEETFVSVPGVYLAPTRTITKNIALSSRQSASAAPASERRRTPCLFSDYLHPTLHCYAPIAATIVETVERAIDDHAALKRGQPECVGAHGVVPADAFTPVPAASSWETTDASPSPPPSPRRFNYVMKLSARDAAQNVATAAGTRQRPSAPARLPSSAPRGRFEYARLSIRDASDNVALAGTPKPTSIRQPPSPERPSATRDGFQTPFMAPCAVPPKCADSSPWWAFFANGAVVGATFQFLLGRRCSAVQVARGAGATH